MDATLPRSWTLVIPESRIAHCLVAIDNGSHRFDVMRGQAACKTQLGTVWRKPETCVFSRGLIGWRRSGPVV